MVERDLGIHFSTGRATEFITKGQLVFFRVFQPKHLLLVLDHLHPPATLTDRTTPDHRVILRFLTDMEDDVCDTVHDVRDGSGRLTVNDVDHDAVVLECLEDTSMAGSTTVIRQVDLEVEFVTTVRTARCGRRFAVAPSLRPDVTAHDTATRCTTESSTLSPGGCCRPTSPRRCDRRGTDTSITGWDDEETWFDRRLSVMFRRVICVVIVKVFVVVVVIFFVLTSTTVAVGFLVQHGPTSCGIVCCIVVHHTILLRRLLMLLLLLLLLHMPAR
mmetsp:Transcript_25420/g.60087  ORF Transcript_25420/g.60087 Transcript_25420/m.60087 type:complete len:273 (+) Transcript_25420:1264-2082(+)